VRSVRRPTNHARNGQWPRKKIVQSGGSAASARPTLRTVRGVTRRENSTSSSITSTARSLFASASAPTARCASQMPTLGASGCAAGRWKVTSRHRPSRWNCEAALAARSGRLLREMQ
jgi:hypothetical protein